MAVPIGSMLAWKRGDLAGVTCRLLGGLRVAAAAAMLLWLGLHDFRASLALAGIGARRLGDRGLAERACAAPRRRSAARSSAASSARARGLPRSAWAMTMAHVGLGVLILGITVQSAGQVERILVMQPGETADLVGYDVRFDGVGDGAGAELHGPARRPSP